MVALCRLPRQLRCPKREIYINWGFYFTCLLLPLRVEKYFVIAESGGLRDETRLLFRRWRLGIIISPIRHFYSFLRLYAKTESGIGKISCQAATSPNPPSDCISKKQRWSKLIQKKVPPAVNRLGRLLPRLQSSSSDLHHRTSLGLLCLGGCINKQIVPTTKHETKPALIALERRLLTPIFAKIRA